MMNRNSNDFQMAHIPTLQSIDAHSQVSIDLKPNEQQPLVSKIFLLCIELQRKDMIIDQLQTQIQYNSHMKRSQVDLSNKQLLSRYDRIQQENRVLIQSNVLLKNNVASMERIIADLEVHRQRSNYNKELQEKVYNLQLKLKKADEEKIEYQEREKNLKRENSMLSFSAIKTSQKNRIRDLQHELQQERAKVEIEKRLVAQLRYQLEKDSAEIKSLKENEYTIMRTYQERIQKIQMIRVNEDLRKSQLTAVSEEKMALFAQQLNRLRQELDNQKRTLKEQREKWGKKEEQNKLFSGRIKILEAEIKQQRASFGNRKQEEKKRQQEYKTRIQNYQKVIKQMKIGHQDLEIRLRQKQTEDNEKNFDNETLRAQLNLLQKEMQASKSEIRKLKRKLANFPSQCQICKIRSSKTISSSKSIDGANTVMKLEEIIKQTEKLNLSNKKVESLINHHQISLQYSQQTVLNITEQ